MAGATVIVPTIEDGDNAFALLFGVYSRAVGTSTEVTFDFTGCRFLSPDAVAFLGGLWQLLNHKGFRVYVTGQKESEAYRFLRGTGFTQWFGLPYKNLHSTTSPFRCDIEQDKDTIVGYLSDWIGENISLSTNLKRAIISNVWEIYSNSFEHSKSPIGVASFGQLYPRMKRLRLTLVDFGIGIVSSVRNFLGDQQMGSGEAVKWAFEEGNTTKPAEFSRGIGLELLREFVTLNGGELQVISNDVQASIIDNEICYTAHQWEFKGTMVHITVRCDGRRYSFADEDATAPIF